MLGRKSGQVQVNFKAKGCYQEEVDVEIQAKINMKK